MPGRASPVHRAGFRRRLSRPGQPDAGGRVDSEGCKLRGPLGRDRTPQPRAPVPAEEVLHKCLRLAGTNRPEVGAAGRPHVGPRTAHEAGEESDAERIAAPPEAVPALYWRAALHASRAALAAGDSTADGPDVVVGQHVDVGD